MNTSKPIAICMIATLLSLSSLHAQDDKIILYNSNPVKVQLAGDKIAAFVGEAPSDYMKGYDLAKPNDVTIVHQADQVTSAPAASSDLVNGQYSVMSNERILLNYKEGYATLDKAIINALDEVALRVKADPSIVVLLTAHSQEETASADKLSANRLSSAQTYLKIKGVPLDRIRTESVLGVNLNDVVSINFMQ